MQPLGVEWSNQSSELAMGRERALVEAFLKVALEHDVAWRVGSGAGV